ncbi:12857_t:CDS:2 [Rhizophagus irregularis]|uniref:Uncharacterized protein n=1 Tax=Rhizophagus irregularis (strain DAOM 197198w) TaxID=1432141 RepID=A0A015LA68_RHIIW|nr:hypothetical protein RirG_259650 [Rhizophagus irregularis DAOM 197198w]CAG8695560.1 12857_t:CDS:2 [Rhizophagus irregularis]
MKTDDAITLVSRLISPNDFSKNSNLFSNKTLKRDFRDHIKADDETRMDYEMQKYDQWGERIQHRGAR